MKDMLKNYWRLVAALVLVLSAHVLLAQSTVTSIPNQKLINGSYVSNPDGILDDTTVVRIDSLLGTLEAKASVQVAVVAVESIGEADVFEFAQTLFTNWGIGSKENDNGLLLLLVKQSHTIRFHTGYGIEGVLPDVVCKRIQRDYMVPEFKNGNYNAGMLAGIQQVVKAVSDPAYVDELKAPAGNNVDGFSTFVILFGLVVLIVFVIKALSGTFADSKIKKYTPYPEMRLTRGRWVLEFFVVPAMIVAVLGFFVEDNSLGFSIIVLYLYLIVTLFIRIRRMKKVIERFMGWQDYYNIVEFIRKGQVYWFFMALIFPIPFLAYFFYHLASKRLYRNHQRKCERCGGEMLKLNEKG